MNYRDVILWVGLGFATVGIGQYSKVAALIFYGACIALVGLRARAKRRRGRCGWNARAKQCGNVAPLDVHKILEEENRKWMQSLRTGRRD